MKTKYILPNTTGAEGTISTGLTSFDTNGFTIGSEGGHNNNGDDFVAWCWKAGGAVSADNNSEGDITSTVSANPDAGFSIVKWIGSGSQPQTVGHGLSSAPEMIIYKNTDTTSNWHVYHESVMNAGDAKFLRLNTTDAILTDGFSDVWTSGFSPTTFGIGDANNGSGNTHIAYCFHSVDGYQKVGSYEGNGSANGATVTTGFQPRFLLLKNADRGDASYDYWQIFDSVRGDNVLYPNSNIDEDAFEAVDFLPNGFQIVLPNQVVNNNGSTYIYLAIA